LQSAFSEGGEHLEPIPTWKHEIQNDEIELLGVDEKKSFLSVGRDNDFIALAL